MNELRPWRAGPVLLGILAVSIVAYVALGTYLQTQATVLTSGSTHAKITHPRRK